MEDATLHVGWSCIDITPQIPLPLDGMGNDYLRRDNWVAPEGEDDRLKASLILFSDGKTEAVLCAMDTLFIHELFSEPAARAVADAIGISEKNVFFSGSHTHSGVSMDEQDPDVLAYNQNLCHALAEAALQAKKNLRVSRVQVGSVQTVGMNAQRRYVLKDGSHRSSVHDKSYTSEDIASYETTPDPTLRVIRFCRDADKDIVLVNWQMHPSFTGSFQVGKVSADAIGTIRTQWQTEEPDCHFAFFQGAGGNMARTSRWSADPGFDKMKSMTRQSYAREFVRLIRKEIAFQEVKAADVQVTNQILSVHKKDGRQILPEQNHLPLNTLRIGQIAFCTVPGEIFSDAGLDLRRRAGLAMTFVCSNSNGCYGYLPVQACFDGETWGTVHEKGDSFEVRVSKCEPGTAEKIVDALVAALDA